MKSWAIGVIVLLVIGLGALGYLFMKTNNDLAQTRSDLGQTRDDLTQRNSDLSLAQGDLSKTRSDLAMRQSDLTQSQSQVEDLRNTVYSVQAKSAGQDLTISDLQVYLKDATNKATTLQSGLKNSQDDVKAQQAINGSLSTELKKVEDPRHFSTVAELTDWLAQDDTNKVYANERPSTIGYILEVRALRAGFILPVSVWIQNNIIYFGNVAVIGDSLYDVDASKDAINKFATFQPIPSHPLPLQ
jgi:hypothetical protein